ncbi:MAG: endonuclease/exonuclease/phosphatase family protein [Minisyncoccota bacterium]
MIPIKNTKMIIYSWNMLYRNRELDRAFQFIMRSDFDIFCLQEVPEEILARLRTLSFNIAYRSDMEKVFPSGVVPMFNVILSRHPITDQGEISFADYQSLLPLRTRLFMRLMPSNLFSEIRNRGGLYVDIHEDGRPLRVFNLHLILAHPERRLEEFERAMLKHDPSRPTIVCGDFNVLEKPHITPLNWILGGRLSDALFYRRERTAIKRRFVEHHLQNALSGRVTHPLSRSQLDHILVSHSFSVTKADVLPDRIGSDHHPIRVEVT